MDEGAKDRVIAAVVALLMAAQVALVVDQLYDGKLSSGIGEWWRKAAWRWRAHRNIEEHVATEAGQVIWEAMRIVEEGA